MAPWYSVSSGYMMQPFTPRKWMFTACRPSLLAFDIVFKNIRRAHPAHQSATDAYLLIR
jgi:hypothetical protein